MSQFMQQFMLWREQKNYAAIVQALPYMQLMGMKISDNNQEGLCFSLPFSLHNVGNTALPALHGGLIGGFMESAAFIHLMWHSESLSAPKIVDLSLDYLRPGREHTLYAACEITRQGKRVANVLIEAWQTERDKPVSVARAHFLLN